MFNNVSYKVTIGFLWWPPSDVDGSICVIMIPQFRYWPWGCWVKARIYIENVCKVWLHGTIYSMCTCGYAITKLYTVAVAEKEETLWHTSNNSLDCNVWKWEADVNGPAPAVVVAATLHMYLVYDFKLVKL